MPRKYMAVVPGLQDPDDVFVQYFDCSNNQMAKSVAILVFKYCSLEGVTVYSKQLEPLGNTTVIKKQPEFLERCKTALSRINFELSANFSGVAGDLYQSDKKKIESYVQWCQSGQPDDDPAAD